MQPEAMPTATPRPESLAALQRRFWRLLVAPEGVAAGVEAWAAEDADASEAARPERWIVADDRETAERRLSVYANMYFHRLHDLLAGDFPTLRALLGAERFHNLVTDYLVAHPPDTPTVRDIGAALPAFIAAGHPMTEPWPYAAAIAELEWARVDVIDGADQPPLSAETLTALPAESWAALPLELTAATRVLRLAYAVLPLWRAVADGEPLGPLVEAGIARAATAALVWRKGHAVCHRHADEQEARALHLLAEGTTFGVVCALAAEDAGEREAAQQAIGWLRRWLRDELLRHDD